MNFSEFLESLVDPLYEVKGDVPKCPPGYKWDTKTLRCIPKTDKDKIDANIGIDSSPENMPDFRVWGATGYDGGYALEVEEGYDSKWEKKQKEREEEHKKKDDRMRYGKKGKAYHDATALRPGEVKRWDDIEKRWVSNKEEE